MLSISSGQEWGSVLLCKGIFNCVVYDMWSLQPTVYTPLWPLWLFTCHWPLLHLLLTYLLAAVHAISWTNCLGHIESKCKQGNIIIIWKKKEEYYWTVVNRTDYCMSLLRVQLMSALYVESAIQLFHLWRHSQRCDRLYSLCTGVACGTGVGWLYMHLFTGKYIVVSDLVDGQCLSV